MRRFLWVVFVAGCAAPPQGTSEPPAPAAPPPLPETPLARETVAVAELMESARGDAAAGRLVQAAGTLERALRIEPRNPRLWHELAKVRMRQGDAAQAANLAARSNSFAGSDGVLRAANQSIIEQARSGGLR